MAAEDPTFGAYPGEQGAEDSVGAWELVVHERHGPKVLPLREKGELTIGRAAHSDVRLDHVSISRAHARIHLPSLDVEDLRSRNGSWIWEGRASASLGSLLDRVAEEGDRLLPGVRRRFGPGAVLKLGEVICQVQRVLPASLTLPVCAAREDDGIVLEDPSMAQLYALAERSADSALPLLIMGETGVGKDVLAARVHQASARKRGPFVRINCAALSESLLESELFGHEQGSSASEGKAGLFEVGHGGTVFLDEIGALPLRTQVKLLHVLETKEVTRVGATKSQRIDVRFIAATNRELGRDVQAGSFRKDLYFRINTLCLKIEPLRNRRADILPLVRHFLRRACARAGIPEPLLLPETEAHLQQYAWPGNVRELKNSIERARLLCGSQPLLPEHFPTERELLNPAPDMMDVWPDEAPTQVGQRVSFAVALPPTDHTALIEALESCGGNQTRAAELLGISRRTLVNRLNEFNLPRPRKGRA